MDGWMDGWMGRWVDGWMDGWRLRPRQKQQSFLRAVILWGSHRPTHRVHTPGAGSPEDSWRLAAPPLPRGVGLQGRSGSALV